jgi:hypothetical protein
MISQMMSQDEIAPDSRCFSATMHQRLNLNPIMVCIAGDSMGQAQMVIITYKGKFNNAAERKKYINNLKYQRLVGKMVEKGELLSFDKNAIVLHTSPSGVVTVGDQTTIELEEMPYITWISRGVEKGEFMDYPQWLTRLMVRYNINLDIDEIFQEDEE